MPIAQFDGGEVHYVICGSGSSLIMLMPQSSGPVGVKPFVDAVAARFSVVQADQLGTGLSSAPLHSGPIGMVERANEVAGLLTALGPQRLLPGLRPATCPPLSLPSPRRPAASPQPLSCFQEVDHQ